MNKEQFVRGIISFVDKEIMVHPHVSIEDKAKILIATDLGLFNPVSFVETLASQDMLKDSNLWVNGDTTEINAEQIKTTTYKLLDLFGGEYPLPDGITINLGMLRVSILKGFVIQRGQLDRLFQHIEAI